LFIEKGWQVEICQQELAWIKNEFSKREKREKQ